MFEDDLAIPDFLIISPEERAAAWRRNPPQAMKPEARQLTDIEREELAARQRKAIEQHNRGYDMGRKLAEMSPEDKALMKAKRKLRKARRK